MILTCPNCGRKVRDSFTDKLTHVAVFHPERIVIALPMLANIARVFGENIGERVKGSFENDTKSS